MYKNSKDVTSNKEKVDESNGELNKLQEENITLREINKETTGAVTEGINIFFFKSQKGSKRTKNPGGRS